jgi:predicted DNA-binding protein
MHRMEALMDRQLTVRITDVLADRLDQAAREMRRKRSDVVRLALEEFLGEPDSEKLPRPVDLARDLIGSVESGIPDLGQNHRQHLLTRLRHAR